MPPGKFTFKSKKTDSKLTQQSILGFINPSPKPTVGCDLKREHRFQFYFTKVMENRLDDKNTTANSRFCVKYPTQCDRSSLFYQTGIVSFFESYFFSFDRVVTGLRLCSIVPSTKTILHDLCQKNNNSSLPFSN